MLRTNYSSKYKPVRSEHDGKSFDSLSEKDFYFTLKKIFYRARIIRPCNVTLRGKSRAWKCDFGVCATSTSDAEKLGRITCALQGREYDSIPRGLVYVEYKGKVDLQSGFLAPDKNFISRVEHLVKYEPDILSNSIFVGKGSGAIITYLHDGSYRATPVHVVSYFVEKVKELW